MESILEVANLLIHQHYNAVVDKSTSLIAHSDTTAEDKDTLYFYRAVAYSGKGDFDSTLKDLESCEGSQGNNPNWLYRYGVAQFNTNDFSNALISFKKAEEGASDEEFKAAIHTWSNKTELELGNSHVGNINDAIFLKTEAPSQIESSKEQEVTASQPIIAEGGKNIKEVPHDWYQNNDFVFLSLLKKKITGDWKVALLNRSVSITLSNGEVVFLELSNHIDDTNSSFTQTDKKVEIKLKKKDMGITWSALSKEEIASKPMNVAPAYPSSNKKHTDWSEVNKTLTKELHLAKKEKEDNGDGMNELFQQIYSGADEETKRAMIKSYQTSNGTVLSTNWDEVAKKDYEGKDYVSPPDSFIEKKPEY